MKMLKTKKIIISGVVLTIIGFVIMIVSLMKTYDYASKDCKANVCPGLDRASFFVHVGIGVFVLGFVVSALGAVVNIYSGYAHRK
ncbi:MAG: hypothetical protein NTX11_02045 [Candidatus Saccharibacteria bacterium]|nr:hypothetical protein [Candidatus Saccharibacteria bacterium]